MRHPDRKRPELRLARKSAYLLLGIGLIECGNVAMRAIAGDLLFLLTSPSHQDSVALGQIVAVQGEQLIFQPKAIVMGDRLPRRLTLTVNEEQPKAGELDSGDLAVLPLKKQQGQYRISHDAFRVDSLDMTQTRVLDGPLGLDNWAFNWFVNSCGQEAKFSFDYEQGQAWVERQGQRIPIGVMKGDRWERAATASPLPCTPHGNGWWSRFLQRFRP